MVDPDSQSLQRDNSAEPGAVEGKPASNRRRSRKRSGLPPFDLPPEMAGSSFRYEIGGKLSPISPPFDLSEISTEVVETGTMQEMLKFGQEFGIELRIVEQYEGEHCRWWLVIGVHPCSCIIEVNGWPAFLDALNRYAPMLNMDSTDWIRVVSEQYEKQPLN